MIWAFRALGVFAYVVSKAWLGLLILFGFLFRHRITLILTLIGSGVLVGYGVYNGLLWRTPPAPQAGPGQYQPPVPGPVAAPAPGPAPAPVPSLPPAGPSVVPAPKAPVIVLLPQHPRPSAAPVVLAEPIPELAGIAPPPPGPPPLPDAPFAVVRGYRPPLTDR